MQVVLQGRSGNEHSSSRSECSDDLTEERIDILDSVGLVDNDVLPTELLQRRLFPDTKLVGSDENVKLLGEDDAVDLLGLSVSASKSQSEVQSLLTRSSLDPDKTAVRNPGTHLWTSRFQLSKVDLGTTIKCGPAMLRWNLRYPRKEIV